MKCKDRLSGSCAKSAGNVNSTSSTLYHRTSVKIIVNEAFEILLHMDLSHQLTDVGEKLEGAEKVTFPLRLGWPMFQRVQDALLKQFLIQNTNFDS